MWKRCVWGRQRSRTIFIKLPRLGKSFGAQKSPAESAHDALYESCGLGVGGGLNHVVYQPFAVAFRCQERSHLLEYLRRANDGNVAAEKFRTRQLHVEAH